jgi:hypothetical protein
MGEYNHNPFSYWMKGDSLVHWSEHQGIPLTDDAPEFCWVDIETTGLDRTQDRILEIGLVLTNGIGEVCMDGVIDWRVFVHGGNEDQKGAEYLTALSRLESNPIVSEMHKKSGLLLNIFSDARHPEYMKTHPDTVQVEARNWLAERPRRRAITVCNCPARLRTSTAASCRIRCPTWRTGSTTGRAWT